MKVVLINKSDSVGGASVAAYRLTAALHNNNVDAKLLVSDGMDSVLVEVVNKSYVSQQFAYIRYLKDRLFFLPYEKNAIERFSFSPGKSGMDISSHPLVQEADIIHLHWINDGFISLKGLQKLIGLGKPIVWTLHDMWAFTGGCHYNGSCHEFLESCGYCRFLKKPHAKDLSSRIYKKKKILYKNANIQWVTCSKWLKSLAIESSLIRNRPCTIIPNPIDTDFYRPMDKDFCRDSLDLPKNKKLLLFGAAHLNDPRKGIRYLAEALEILHENFPVLHDKLELVVFGKLKKGDHLPFPFKTHFLKYVNNPMTLVKIYNACDAYVLPSLQDNLPNTVMESMACATPVIGFRIGGVPEMIQHEKSGYLSEVRNALSLSTGIYETLFINDAEEMGMYARENVIESYSETKVAKQYIEIYQKALEGKLKN
ncbi:MAG: glycosyltransferase [Marinilabiliaceae bacterium]|nr:glycosyltransferase [Marinilabiliaceae bacterium]